MLDGLAAWWGSVELWLAQQWFPVQFALVILVVAPLCAGGALLIDRIGESLDGRRRRRAARAVRRS